MEIKEICKEFVQCIKDDNKPKAYSLFGNLVNQKIKDRIEERKQEILASRKIFTRA